jgi:hypothetical protein
MFQPFVRPPRFAEVELSTRLASIRITPSDAGIVIPMLDGGKVSQTEPLPEGASLSRASQEIALSYSAATEEDSRLAGMVEAMCRGGELVPLTIWSVVSDYWPITATLRTSWPLSRRSAPTPPDVHSGRVLHADGTKTDLTLISGTPSAGQIAIADGIATTDDLTAYAGAFLEVRYYPIYMIASVSRTEEASEPGSLAFELTLQEWLP